MSIIFAFTIREVSDSGNVVNAIAPVKSSMRQLSEFVYLIANY